jgi:hypothetical protein
VSRQPHPSGFTADPETGLVYGRNGAAPIRKRDSKGYVRTNREGCRVPAHRVVWEAVNGPVPDGMEINHVNGVKDDNRIANLELVTTQGNAQHAFAMGLRQPMRGESNGRSVLTEADVLVIRAEYDTRRYGTIKALAERFGVSTMVINAVGRRRLWRHVPEAVA